MVLKTSFDGDIVSLCSAGDIGSLCSGAALLFRCPLGVSSPCHPHRGSLLLRRGSVCSSVCTRLPGDTLKDTEALERLR